MTHFLPGEEFVEVTGFYYETKEGKPFLSATPNVRSCCKGAKEKKDEQLFLPTALSLNEGEVVRMRGVIADEGSTLILKEAEYQERSFSMMELGGSVCMVMILFLAVRRLF